jgi:hypothetical protein
MFTAGGGVGQGQFSVCRSLGTCNGKNRLYVLLAIGSGKQIHIRI